MTDHTVIENRAEVPFKLERTSDHILEISPKLSNTQKKALRNRTAVVRAYLFDEEDANRLMRAEIIDLGEEENKGYFSNIVSFMRDNWIQSKD